jgi:hypothetical protein
MIVKPDEILRTKMFDKYYCCCGLETNKESSLYLHVKTEHLTVYKVFNHLRTTHIPVSLFDLGDVVDKNNRSEFLGSVSE